MSTGLAPRSNNTNGARAKPLQASTNIIHTKIPRRIDNILHDRARQTGKQLLEGAPTKESVSHLKNLKKAETKSSQKAKLDENNVGDFIKSQEKGTTTSATPKIEQVDENDVSSFVKNAYDPLKDVYPLDEELYQKVLKLELADDGLPSFELDEPFDF